MKKMTEKNLKEAFAGESQAHMKYLAFAQKAEAEGKPNIAKLFRATAFAEQVHAINHLRVLGDIGTTEENLQSGVEGEDFEIEEMYPAYDAVAKLQQEKDAIRTIHYAIEAEKIHSSFYSKAKQKIKENQDIDLEKINICPVCGYTSEEAPDTCPVCGAKKEKFVEFK